MTTMDYIISQLKKNPNATVLGHTSESIGLTDKDTKMKVGNNTYRTDGKDHIVSCIPLDE